jgi:hypothetical protein
MANRDTTAAPNPVTEFLERYRRVFLLSLRKDGSPTAHPMVGTLNQGALQFNTYRKSAKARNVQKDPRVCCLVVNGYDTSEGVQAVLVRGKGTFQEGSTQPQQQTPSGTGSPQMPRVGPGIQRTVAERLQSGKRLFLRVSLEESRFLGTSREG